MTGRSKLEEVASPCTKVCTLDVDERLCIGCLRSTDEIAGWARASSDDRRAILAAVSQRRAARKV